MTSKAAVTSPGYAQVQLEERCGVVPRQAAVPEGAHQMGGQRDPGGVQKEAEGAGHGPAAGHR